MAFAGLVLAALLPGGALAAGTSAQEHGCVAVGAAAWSVLVAAGGELPSPRGGVRRAADAGSSGLERAPEGARAHHASAEAPPASRSWGGILVAVFLAALALGAAYQYWNVVEHRFVTIVPGRLYQSAEMPPETLGRKVEKHGIRTVVDLRRPGEWVEAERAALARAGVEHVHLQSSQMPSGELIASFFDLMEDEGRLPVLVHCKHGRGRSVFLASVYRIEFEGWSPGRAWIATSYVPFWGTFSPFRRKGKELLSYVPSRQRRPSRGGGG